MQANKFSFSEEDDAQEFLDYKLPSLPPPPPCFTLEQWTEWAFRHWRTDKTAVLSITCEESYCFDCTPEYQQTCREQGTCGFLSARQSWGWTPYNIIGSPHVAFRDHGVTGEYYLMMVRPWQTHYDAAHRAGLVFVLHALKNCPHE